ncbi:MAG: tetratricopeptide repeat protein, partial [Deltaproteobacteria bacterium]|nr:tetratricopeptide repeat protein [Deltaproteobacteria bacterium]
MTELDDDEDDPRTDEARSLASAGDLAGAAALLGRVVADRPDDAEAQRDLGLVLRASGDLEGARAALARAVELDDEDASTRQILARVLEGLGRVDEAVFQLVRAASIDPDDASVAHDLGVAFYKRGRHAKAIEALARAGSLRPDARTSYALGLAHEGARDMASAIAAHRDAVARDPRFVDAHLALADALAGLGEHGEAIEVYDQLLRIDRTNAQAAH